MLNRKQVVDTPEGLRVRNRWVAAILVCFAILVAVNAVFMYLAVTTGEEVSESYRVEAR